MLATWELLGNVVCGRVVQFLYLWDLELALRCSEVRTDAYDRLCYPNLFGRSAGLAVLRTSRHISLRRTPVSASWTPDDISNIARDFHRA